MSLKKHAQALSLVFLTVGCAPNYKNSENVENQNFDQALAEIKNSADHPVVFINHDLIRNNALARQSDEISFADAVLIEFSEEISRQTGIAIPFNHLSGLTGNLELKSALPSNYQGSAAWQGQRYANLNSSHTQGQVFCVVKPYSSQVNPQDFTRDFMFFQPYIYDERYHENDIPALNRNVLPLFVNYHELAHCLDTRYAIRIDHDVELNRDNLGLSVLNRHRSEVFADTLSILMMAKFNNILDASDLLANQRRAQSWYMGQHYSPHTDFWYAMAGSVYYTSDAIEAAQIYIDSLNRVEIEELLVRDMMDLAYSITEQHSLSFDQMNALQRSYADPCYVHEIEAVHKAHDHLQVHYEFLTKYFPQLNISANLALGQDDTADFNILNECS